MIDLSKWDDVSKTLGAIDGKTYGLTMGNSAQCMLYDPAVFEQAGLDKPTMDWTWDDYHTALKQIQEKTGMYGDSEKNLCSIFCEHHACGSQFMQYGGKTRQGSCGLL